MEYFLKRDHGQHYVYFFNFFFLSLYITNKRFLSFFQTTVELKGRWFAVNTSYFLPRQLLVYGEAFVQHLCPTFDMMMSLLINSISIWELFYCCHDAFQMKLATTNSYGCQTNKLWTMVYNISLIY